MSSVDSRIVQMKFDNSRFERGVATTLGTLNKLKTALNFGASKKSLEELQGSANRFNMGGMGTAVSGVSGKFLALATIAATVLGNITSRVVDTGLAMAKSLTLEPIMQGFEEYEIKMGSIQTILSNTSRHGTTLKDVTNNLDDLNEYADKTIYSFADMTRNIGLFTNAGIGIEDSTAMIKGFSNEAAASGTNSQGAASAAYQLSQALSAGTIRLMDWRSLQNVGMGNKNMQRGLIEIADAMGTFEGTSMTAKKAADDFNGSLEEKWLTADVMENYLKIQAGELTKAQIKNLGLTDQQATALLKQQKIAEEAATKVRTFTQLIGTLQEAAGSGWAETFDIILGDFNEATELFTGAEQAIGGMLGKQADARNKVLEGWSQLGGRDAVIEGIANSFKGLLAVLKPIGKAFRDVFPKKTAQDLYRLSIQFRDLTRQFKMGGETSERIRRIFRGVFAIFSIGWQIVKKVVGIFFNLFSTIFKGSGGALEFLASLGDFFYNIDQGLKKGEGLNSFFEGLSKVLGKVGLGFGDAFKGIADFVDRVNLLEKAKKLLSSFWETAKEVFGGLGKAIGQAFDTASLDPILSMINTGILGGIFLAIRKFFKDMTGKDISGGLIDSIKDTLGQLTDTLTAMQTQLQVKTLMSIAIAVGLLAASIFVLSKIDSKSLSKALSALAVGMAQLLGAMVLMMKLGGPFVMAAQLMIMSAALVFMAGAILILSGAVKVMSTMSWDELARGLTGVAGAIGIMVAATKFLSKGAAGMLIASVGIMALGVAMNLLAVAMKIFASMSLGEMAKGLIMVAGSLGIIALGMKAMPKRLMVLGPALVAVAIALNLIATALRTFGGMDVVSMVTGLAAMGGSLAILALALKAMPKNIMFMSVGLMAVGVALNLIAVALRIFGGMTIGEIAKSFLALGGALMILAIGLKAMTGTLIGSAALLLASVAISALVPPLLLLSKMSVGEIAKSLITLAAALTILGIAGHVISVASLAIVALGVGVALMGAGFLLAATATHTFVKAFALFVETMKTGRDEIMNTIGVIAKIIFEVFSGLAQGVVAFVVVLAENIPVWTAAMSKLIGAFLQVVIDNIPKIAEFLGRLMFAGLEFLQTMVPKFIETGLTLLVALLKGLAENIWQITTSAAKIVTSFLTALAARMPQLVTAGTNFIVRLALGLSNNMYRLVTAGVTVIMKFLAGVNAHIPRLVTAGMTIIVSILNAISSNMYRLVTAGANVIVKLLNGIAKNMPRIVTAGANIIIRMMGSIGANLWRVINTGANIIIKILEGISKKIPQVVSAGTRVVTRFVGAIGSSIWKITNQGSNMILKILTGMSKKFPQIVRAGGDVIVKTLNGIAKQMPRITRAGGNVIVSFLNGLNKEMPRIADAAFKTLITFINSLTTAINNNQQKLNRASQRLAKAIIDGMVWGLKWNAGKVGDAAVKVARDALKGAKQWLGINSPSKRFRDEVGKGIPEGIALGVDENGNQVVKSVKGVAQSALSTAKAAIARVGASLEDDANMSPVIRPVLDLSDIQRNAPLLDGMLNTSPLTPAASYSQASAIAQDLRRGMESRNPVTELDAQRKIEFNQYNSSPKALSEVEIYRQTRNQLSAAKGALKV